jgi:hypothetical protein
LKNKFEEIVSRCLEIILVLTNFEGTGRESWLESDGALPIEQRQTKAVDSFHLAWPTRAG